MTPLPLVDIGINLAHDSFDADRDAVLARARRAGLVHLIVTGSSRASSVAAAALAARQPALLSATAGVHPHHALELEDGDLAGLRALLAEPQVVAVGECGLDYCRDYSPRDAQRRAFERQVELAIDCGKPLFLHQRDAHADFLAVLTACGAQLPRAVAHCFTGTPAEAEAYLALGLSIGITGWICDERRGQRVREAIAGIPAGRLMIETDSPYLLPRDLDPRPRSRRNEPKFLPHIARTIAAARRETFEQVAAFTTANALEFFDLRRGVAAESTGW